MQNVTSATLAVRATAAALQDVFEDTGTRWPLGKSGVADLTTTAGAWGMLQGGYYDEAGIPSSPAFRTMLAGYIVDVATAADLDYLIDDEAGEHESVSKAVCALLAELKAAAIDVFYDAPGFASHAERSAAVKAFFAGETSEALDDLVTESIIVGVRIVGEEDLADAVAVA